MRKLVIVALCTVALAGCHSRTANVTFTPAALKDCGTTNAPSVLEVHWDATQAKPKNGVKLWINNDPAPKRTGIFGGDPGTLWVGGGDTGTATTGPWMFPGTTVIVTDAKNDDVLTTVKVPAAPCK